MPFTLKPTVQLNNGVSMPLLGLGVYLMRPGTETYHAVKASLEIGYRLVDTASFYRNEEDVGKAVRDSTVPREELFIATTTTATTPHCGPSTLPSGAWASNTLIFTSSQGSTAARTHQFTANSALRTESSFD